LKFIHCLFLAVALFIGGFLSGLLAPVPITNNITGSLNPLQSLAEHIYSLPIFLGALAIFAKNAFAVGFSFIFSPLLCLVPVITLLANGWILGYISLVTTQQTSFGYVLAGLLPHGIIELPAVIIGEAAALSFGTTLIAYLITQRKPVTSFKTNLKYLIISILLLLPAAFIERFITPLFLNVS